MCFFFFLLVLFSVNAASSICIRGLTKDVSSEVGAPWRCGAMTTWGGTAGIRLFHLLGREHDPTSQSGVEAPRLLKRSLSRLCYCCCVVVVLLLFLTMVNEAKCLCQHASTISLCRSPRRRRTLHRRGLRKLALNSRTTCRSAKNAEKTLKTPHRRYTTLEAFPSLLRTKMSTNSGDELNLWHFPCSRDNCRCMITATYMTADMHLRHQHDLHNRDIGHLQRALQLRDLRSFLHVEPRASVVVHNGHVNDNVQPQRVATVGFRPTSHGLHPRNC